MLSWLINTTLAVFSLIVYVLMTMGNPVRYLAFYSLVPGVLLIVLGPVIGANPILFIPSRGIGFRASLEESRPLPRGLWFFLGWIFIAFGIAFHFLFAPYLR